MNIHEKQSKWKQERPLFEADFIHSHLLPFFNFNENTGEYEIKSECVKNADDEDQRVAYETLNTGWVMWLRAKRAKTQAVPEGFVLVPRVATKQMVNAGYEAHDGFFTNGQVQDVYQAMIEAQEPTND